MCNVPVFCIEEINKITIVTAQLYQNLTNLELDDSNIVPIGVRVLIVATGANVSGHYC